MESEGSSLSLKKPITGYYVLYKAIGKYPIMHWYLSLDVCTCCTANVWNWITWI